MSQPTVRETLIRAIRDSKSHGRKFSEVAISDYAARALAEEMALMQLTPKTTAEEIYAGMKAGGSKFLGLKLVVAS